MKKKFFSRELLKKVSYWAIIGCLSGGIFTELKKGYIARKENSRIKLSFSHHLDMHMDESGIKRDYEAKARLEAEARRRAEQDSVWREERKKNEAAQKEREKERQRQLDEKAQDSRERYGAVLLSLNHIRESEGW